MAIENIKQELYRYGENVTPEWLNAQLEYCVTKVRQNMTRFKNDFPSACTTDGKYRIKGNDDWTNGFWTGMLWMCYEITGEQQFYEQAVRNCESFTQRLADHYILDHHDIGFLYSLSIGAGFKLTQDESYRETLILAADTLVARYQEKGEFIQAWGTYGDPKEYRLIIDSLINLPLLFQASLLSGDPKYRMIAQKHLHTLLQTVIKPDGTTYHTYYFDPETGEKRHGATHQGNSDDSIWARGQSWAVLGIPLDYRYLKDQAFPAIYPQIVTTFLQHLPHDLIPYWDFDFDDDHPAAKDSSAAAIVACGLLEAAPLNVYEDAASLAKGLIYQLGEHYTSTTINEEGLLLHGVYAHHEGKGIDEANLWGDYFYFEALMRVAHPEWNRYW